MFIRFRAENFRSLKEQQELSLVAASNLRDVPDVVRANEAIESGLLCVAAIYGANASGKTNINRALEFMRVVVENSQRKWGPEAAIPTDPFLLDDTSANGKSTFSVDILLDGIRYEYGFALNSTQVFDEWLFAFPSGRKQLWFRRETSEKTTVRFGKHLLGENRAIENLTRRNSLFLSAAAQNNHEQLTSIYRWFARRLFFVDRERWSLDQRTADRCKDSSFKQHVFKLLGGADLGIVDIEVADEPFADEMKAIFQELTGVIKKIPGASGMPDIPESRTRVSFKHRRSDATGVSFDGDKESAGTIALFALLGPIVAALQSGGVLFVDELDASLHPLLAVEIVRLFNSPTHNPQNAQLIFNTHDTNLLESAGLRRDQVWFVEKDATGASHLYPLTDFKPRRHENLENGYLQGRYGAIPFVNQHSLLDEPV